MNMAALFTTYATCWHASEHESDAHWQIYASGAGIAIVSTGARLRAAVDITPYPHGLLGEVEYLDFETHDMRRRPFPTRIRPGFAKRKSFEYEQEVRGVILAGGLERVARKGQFIMSNRTLKRLAKKMPPGIAVSVNLSELIEKIVLSPFAPAFVEDLVRILAKRCGLEHLVSKSQLLAIPIY